MKKFLIPTDFSVNAGYAINYGAELASQLEASITLLHVFSIPVLTDAAAIDASIIETWQENNDEALRQITEHLLKSHPNLVVETETVPGSADDQILALTSGSKFDMIIMGSKGTGGLGDNLLGNITANIIPKCKIPVLVIPPGYIFKPIQRIVLACHNDQLISSKIEDTINNMVSENHAKLFILSVVREVIEPISAKNEETDKIKIHFENLHPSTYIVEDASVVHGVNTFTEENDIDMVIMIPQHHTLFERLFTEIHTAHMTKATQKPLLTIHE